MKMTRYSENPILTKNDVPFAVNSIFNPGAVKFGNEYLLFCRVEMPNGRSSFVIARSKDWIKFKVEPNLCLTPEEHGDYYKYAEWGIEDARVVKMENKYYLTYTRNWTVFAGGISFSHPRCSIKVILHLPGVLTLEK